MMRDGKLEVSVRWGAEGIAIMDIRGEITAFGESAMMSAYAEINERNAQTIILNCGELTYMNSGGIGLLITLLIRANRQQQRLFVVGLSEHLRHVFLLTKLNEAVPMHEDEAQLLASLGAGAGPT